LAASPLIAEEPIEKPNKREDWSCCRDYNYGNSQGRYFRSYDFQTTKTLEGEVISLDSFLSRSFPGKHLMVQTDKETIEVHLAPSWFLAEQESGLTS